MTLLYLKWPIWIRSLTVTLTVLPFWIYFFVLMLIIAVKCFSLHWKFWSCCCLTFHWLFNKLKTGCLISSCSIWIFLCWLGQSSFEIVWSVLLLLIVNFVIGFRLELIYISLIVNIRWSLTHLHGFHLLLCCCHSS